MSHLMESHGMHNCLSFTIVRVWWYVDVTCSTEAPLSHVSISIWWWSTLINLQMDEGKYVAVKSYQGGILKGWWFSFQNLQLPRNKARKKQSALFCFSDLTSTCKGGKKASARCSESQINMYVMLWSWPCWTLSLWKAMKSLLSERGDCGEFFEGRLSLLHFEVWRRNLLIIS